MEFVRRHKEKNETYGLTDHFKKKMIGTMEKEPHDSMEKPLLEALGIQPKFVDDEGVQGPPVDKEKLERYLERSLGPYASQEVTDLLSSYRTWYEAFCQMIRKRANRESQGK